jgi:uncharacterized membrane protein
MIDNFDSVLVCVGFILSIIASYNIGKYTGEKKAIENS